MGLAHCARFGAEYCGLVGAGKRTNAARPPSLLQRTRPGAPEAVGAPFVTPFDECERGRLAAGGRLQNRGLVAGGVPLLECLPDQEEPHQRYPLGNHQSARRIVFLQHFWQAARPQFPALPEPWFALGGGDLSLMTIPCCCPHDPEELAAIALHQRCTPLHCTRLPQTALMRGRLVILLQ